MSNDRFTKVGVGPDIEPEDNRPTNFVSRPTAAGMGAVASQKEEVRPIGGEVPVSLRQPVAVDLASRAAEVDRAVREMGRATAAAATAHSGQTMKYEDLKPDADPEDADYKTDTSARIAPPPPEPKPNSGSREQVDERALQEAEDKRHAVDFTKPEDEVVLKDPLRDSLWIPRLDKAQEIGGERAANIVGDVNFDLDKAIKALPDDANEAAKMAVAKLFEKRLAEALPWLEDAIAGKPVEEVVINDFEEIDASDAEEIAEAEKADQASAQTSAKGQTAPASVSTVDDEAEVEKRLSIFEITDANEVALSSTLGKIIENFHAKNSLILSTDTEERRAEIMAINRADMAREVMDALISVESGHLSAQSRKPSSKIATIGDKLAGKKVGSVKPRPPLDNENLLYRENAFDIIQSHLLRVIGRNKIIGSDTPVTTEVRNKVSKYVDDTFGPEVKTIDVMDFVLGIIGVVLRALQESVEKKRLSKIDAGVIFSEYAEISSGFLRHIDVNLPRKLGATLANKIASFGEISTPGSLPERKTSKRTTLATTLGMVAIAMGGITAGVAENGGFRDDPLNPTTIEFPEDGADNSYFLSQNISTQSEAYFKIHPKLQQIIDGELPLDEGEGIGIGENFFEACERAIFENYSDPVERFERAKSLRRLQKMIQRGSEVDVAIKDKFGELSKKENSVELYLEFIDMLKAQKIDLNDSDLGLENRQLSDFDAYKYYLDKFEAELLEAGVTKGEFSNIHKVPGGAKVRMKKADGARLTFVQDALRIIGITDQHLKSMASKSVKYGFLDAIPGNNQGINMPTIPKSVLASTMSNGSGVNFTSIDDGKVNVTNFAVLGAARDNAATISSHAINFAEANNLHDSDAIDVTFDDLESPEMILVRLGKMGRTEAGAHLLEKGEMLVPQGFEDVLGALEGVYTQLCESEAKITEIGWIFDELRKDVGSISRILPDGKTYVQLPDEILAELNVVLNKGDSVENVTNAPEIETYELHGDAKLATMVAAADPFQHEKIVDDGWLELIEAHDLNQVRGAVHGMVNNRLAV